MMVQWSSCFQVQQACNQVGNQYKTLASTCKQKNKLCGENVETNQLASSLFIISSKLVIFQPEQAMRAHHDISLMTGGGGEAYS